MVADKVVVLTDCEKDCRKGEEIPIQGNVDGSTFQLVLKYAEYHYALDGNCNLLHSEEDLKKFDINFASTYLGDLATCLEVMTVSAKTVPTGLRNPQQCSYISFCQVHLQTLVY